MAKTSSVYVAIVLLLAVVASASANGCEMDNSALQAMPESTVIFTKDDGEVSKFAVRTANTHSTRSAGFQRVCERAIEQKPILFLFSQPLTPNFHMNNVVAPIDIAFITADGKIDSIQSMKPYVIGSKNRPLYSPRQPVVAALEVHQGFYTKHGIDLSTSVSWQLGATQTQ